MFDFLLLLVAVVPNPRRPPRTTTAAFFLPCFFLVLLAVLFLADNAEQDLEHLLVPGGNATLTPGIVLLWCCRLGNNNGGVLEGTNTTNE